MSKYLGDFPANETVRFSFNTYAPDQTPITLAGVTTQSHFAISKDGVDISSLDASTITITVDAGGVTGFHRVSVVMGNDDDFATGADYEIRLTAGTVATISVVGTVLARWSCENRTAVNVSIRDSAITTNTFDTGVLATDEDIADAVLDELVSGHAIEGSVGAFLTAIDTATSAADTNITTIATIVTTGVAIADGTLTAAKFANDAITAAKIANNAITADKIANNAIDAAALADDVSTEIGKGCAKALGIPMTLTGTPTTTSLVVDDAPTGVTTTQIYNALVLHLASGAYSRITAVSGTAPNLTLAVSPALPAAPADNDEIVVFGQYLASLS